jgi:hypothetical protein
MMQLKLFESLHDDCTAVFLFDNSSNHGIYPNDVLVASRVTLNEKHHKDTTVKLANGDILHQTSFYDKTITNADRKGNKKIQVVRCFKGTALSR